MRLLVVVLLYAATFAYANTVPEQVHTAFAGPNGLAISWFTLNATATSTVLYGLDSKLDQSASGKALNYGMDGFHHHVVIKNLEPHTAYYYAVGDAAGGYSATFSVSTARAPGDPATFTVAILGTFQFL